MSEEQEKIYYKDGIPIVKGVVLTQALVDTYADEYKRAMNYWLLYPDLFLDEIHDDINDPNFHLMYYQREALRSIMRYKNVSFTATRATSKSFISEKLAA